MAGQPRFDVKLYAPSTSTAFGALGRNLEAAGMRVTVRLADPIPVSKLPYGVPWYGSYRLTLRNGKQPSADAVDEAVDAAYQRLRSRFGEAALDVNGALVGSMPPTTK